jgi:hypothetical protein
MISMASSSRSFAALARYLEGSRSGEELDRVDWRAARNLPTDDPEVAARIMRATAAQNPRVEKPVYHLSLSFDSADRVDRAAMERVADRAIEALGLREHQVLIVAHRDRDHPHLHLLINRVHPETGVAWDRWQDRRAIQQVLRDEERAMGLRALAFTALAAERGPDNAVQAMRDTPERFGDLVMAERWRALGLLRAADDGPARESAGTAARLGAAALAAERSAWATASDVQARRLEDAFATALCALYERPADASGEYDRVVRHEGVKHAAVVLRYSPQRLGALRADLAANPAKAASRATDAAALGLEATRASAAARADDVRAWRGVDAVEHAGAELAAARREVARTSEAEHGVRRALATSPSAEELRARIGRAAQRLLPHEVRRLKMLVTAPQLAAVMQLRAAVRDAALGRDDERG